MSSKACTKCKQFRLLSEFYKRNGKAVSICKSCDNLRRKEYYEEHHPVSRRNHHRNPNSSYRICAMCLKEKLFSEFYGNKKSLDKKASYCKNCFNKRRNLLNKGKQYNLSDEQANLLLKQYMKGVCCLCNKPSRGHGKNLHLDHCHITGKIRGMLCHHCNSGLGFLGLDGEASTYLPILLKIQAYLEGSFFLEPSL